MSYRPKKKYRTVKVVLELNTAADMEYLGSVDEWDRVFQWMKPGDAYTDHSKFKVVSAKVKKNSLRK